MATSGTTTFQPDVSEYIEEAFDRCGIEARTGYDARSARRSLNLMLLEWANKGVNFWTVEEITLSLVAGTDEYALAADTVDILDMVVRDLAGAGTESQKDYPVTRMSRQNYLSLPNKLAEGRPQWFYIERTITPALKLWRVPDTTYQVVYHRMRRIQDATYSSNTLDVPFRFYPALAAGLAYYMSIKRAPDRTVLLKGLYDEQWLLATQEDRDRAAFKITPSRAYGKLK